MNSNVPNHIISYVPEILTGYERFIGRDKELQQIKQTLHTENIIIITGCAGIGKSSLAIEYGKQHKQNKVVRYFHASSKAKLDQQYLELAKEFNINVEQQSANLIMQLVNTKLIATQAKLLFIFDNVDNYDDLKEYLVNLPINIKAIITTRQPMLIIDKTHLVLGEFSNEEAEQYLNSSLKTRNFNKLLVRNLIENIGTLPYDIKYLAAYILDNPSTTIDKTTIKGICNKIKDTLFQEFIATPDQTKQHIWKILQYSARLDPDFISIELINKLFPENIELSSAALKKLESLSLISIILDQNDQSGFRIHRKLQKNIQNLAKQNSTNSINEPTLISHLLFIMDQLFPETGYTSNINGLTSNLQPHIEQILNTTSTNLNKQDKIHSINLYYKLAQYYLRANINYQQALEYAKIASVLGDSLFNYNSNSLKLANISNVLGVIYRRLGYVEEGLKQSEKALKIMQQLHAKNHPDIADSLYNVGMAFNQLGKTQEGLKHLQMALDMNKLLYTDNHYKTVNCLNSIGMSYIVLGDFETSFKYIRAGLDMATAIQPINYDRIAELQTNLAYNYNKLGNHTEALKYAKSSMNLMKKHYPDGHPVAIYSLYELGSTLIKTNNIKKGLGLLHQALIISKNFGMDKHFSAAFILHDLGIGYSKNKDYKMALEYTEKAVNLRKEIYKNVETHYYIAESLCALATVNLALGNRNAGLQLYKDSLAMYSALSLEHLSEANEIKQKIKELDSC